MRLGVMRLWNMLAIHNMPWKSIRMNMYLKCRMKLANVINIIMAPKQSASEESKSTGNSGDSNEDGKNDDRILQRQQQNMRYNG